MEDENVQYQSDQFRVRRVPRHSSSQATQVQGPEIGTEFGSPDSPAISRIPFPIPEGTVGGGQEVWVPRPVTKEPDDSKAPGYDPEYTQGHNVMWRVFEILVEQGAKLPEFHAPDHKNWRHIPFCVSALNESQYNDPETEQRVYLQYHAGEKTWHISEMYTPKDGKQFPGRTGMWTRNFFTAMGWLGHWTSISARLDYRDL